ncbi:MAG TPA: cytochrome P450 [Acidimicrobiia bacterium]|nr:cytochrome P450 [Acidimicrobiia bacterium]
MGELYDPFSPQVHEDPYPIYRALRDEYPLYRNGQHGYWVLSRFDDVWDTVHDPATYSSAQGIFPTQRDVATEVLLPMIIMMDPPRHDELRGLVSRAFTPRRISTMEDTIREVAVECTKELVEHGGGDAVETLAAPLPTIVIAELLGVGRADQADFRRWSDALVRGTPDDKATFHAALGAATALYDYFAHVTADRRRRPRDDLVTALVEAQDGDRMLSDEELLGFCFLLLVAGNETTTNLITNGLAALAAHPEQRVTVASDRSLVAAAVEETLRYDAPVQGLARTLTRNVEAYGTTMAAGDRLLILFGSANRDDREFDDADRFDVTRRIDRHLAFGHGIHYCLGAALARLEARIALDELLARAPDYEIDDDAAERLRSGPVRGFERLPLAVNAQV